MRIRVAAALSLALVPFCAASGSDAASPNETVNGFYRVYATFHPSDGIPDAKARARYEPFLSSGLDGLLIAADAAGAKFAAKNKDSPPLMEGDLFTSNFEGASTWTVRDCSTSAGGARCRVDLTFDPADGKNKPVAWTDTVYLVRGGASWRVDDIGYGGNWAFGNKGRLTDTLKDAIRDAGS
jgi:hypothetical protein